MTAISNRMTFIDLFSGAGGFSVGFQNEGFISVFANDNNKDCCLTYNKNFGNHCVCGDIVDIEHFPKTEVVIGGPPCQGFSNLGLHREDDPRNQLWKQFIRVVEQQEPKCVVIENVPPLLKSDEGKNIIDALIDIGYMVEGRILNAADYGSFQKRMRTIILASKTGKLIFPQQTHIDPEKYSEITPEIQKWRTVREAIGDLPLEPTDEDLHFRRHPTSKSIERYKHIPPGGNRWDLPLELMPDCWIRKTSGGTDLFGRLWWDRPSVTIRTEFFKPEKGRYLHPQANRPITHREAARIQGFPDEFIFTGSKISIARQIGNAIPVQLAQAIARAVKKMLD